MGAALKLNTKIIPGIVKGYEFFNPDNTLAGYMKCEEIYTATHLRVAYAKADNVYDVGNKKMISLSDAKKIMSCDYEGVTLAGYWYFFGRSK